MTTPTGTHFSQAASTVVSLRRAGRSLTVLGIVFSALAVSVSTLQAQHGSAQPVTDTKPPRDASQFAFLIGQWDVTVKPKATTLAARIHGAPKLLGTWRAWRALEGWGIEDELRIVDAAGNPQNYTHFLRVYDGASRRWNVSALDVYRGRFTTSNAEWKGDVMLTSSQGTDPEGKAFSSRVTFSRITPSSFRYQQDRSTDGGRTWVEAFLVIEGKRTAAVAPR